MLKTSLFSQNLNRGIRVLKSKNAMFISTIRPAFKANDKSMKAGTTIAEKPLNKAENLDKISNNIKKPNSIHAELILDQKSKDKLKWIPPEKPLSKDEIRKMQQERFAQELPPAPRYFDQTHPVDAEDEKAFMKKMNDILPPYDVRKVPYYVSQPGFQRAFKAYLVFLALVIALTADFDGLNEGNPHIFQGLRRWVFTTWGSIWALDPEEEDSLIRARIEQALAHDSLKETPSS